MATASLLRDPILLRVLVIDFAVVAGAVSLLNGLLPVFARNDAGIAERGIGALFLVNSVLIIGAQLPVARAVEGRSRARMLALMAGCFALCWLLVLGRSYAFLLAGVCVLSLGECLYDSVRSPLVADLAPPGLSGRYLASAGVSWQLGFVVGAGNGRRPARSVAVPSLAGRRVRLHRGGTRRACVARRSRRHSATALISGSSPATGRPEHAAVSREVEPVACGEQDRVRVVVGDGDGATRR